MYIVRCDGVEIISFKVRWRNFPCKGMWWYLPGLSMAYFIELHILPKDQ